MSVMEEQQAGPADEGSLSSAPMPEGGASATPMTNKEKRLAKKAEKQAKQESKKGRAEEKTSRKRKQDDRKEVVEDDKEETKDASTDVDMSAEGGKGEGDAEEEEVEALSHKELRKRRKLEKRGLLKPAEGISEEPVAPLPKRSPYSLWVGNLSFKTSPEKLQQWFEQGQIQGISRVHMPAGAKRGEFNKGFAYVDVPDADTVKAGIGMSEGHLDGRRLLIKSGSDYSGRPEMNSNAVALATGKEVTDEDGETGGAEAAAARQGKTGLTKTAQKILRAQKNPPGPTLFVGNLSFETKVDDLREMVERSAHNRQEFAAKEKPSSEGGAKDGQDKAMRGAGIRKIRMGEFEDTGKCKGFAFIDFFTPAYATASLCDPHNARLLGRELKLEYAGADAIRRGAVKQPGDRPREFNGRRADQVRSSFQRGPRPEGDGIANGAEGEQQQAAPEPGTFDPDAPLPKKHKETKEEREARRAANPAKTNRRVKPGAALANAQRGKVSIDHRASMKAKVTFDD